ncbi:NAD(P)-dependent oxidoreductase [Nocardia cyriacigeorgica]|uniref:NAD(P)-dependent oxidoreductase n=1 Tax=Nocardia cyriacigeorgica TaxID=135487 RepID=A0ABX0CI50_9NOCA|nr:NAD(P)-binding domain-containing protein [Nocardia cyriacigeorgica]NEW55278.1 NAD(P)-dependent oxidoreductase [Nocardia cyriacigeorgica]
MNERVHAPVTVLGLGSMGSALAAALFAAGHPTTVWNRSPGRAAALVESGAVQHLRIADAVTAGPVIISCFSTFAATRTSLAEADLRGRDLITLNSGSPAEARDFAQWAIARGARYLGGAIKNVPSAVGNPDTLLYFGGDRELFDEHANTLRALGGDLEFLGPEPDLAALYEAAVGATLLPALLGFLEGAAVLGTRGHQARTMVGYSIKWLQMIESILPVIAEEIDDRDYTRLGASIEVFHNAIDQDEQIGAESGVDMSWHAPMHAMLRQAVADGRGAQSVTALIELLAKQSGAVAAQ